MKSRATPPQGWLEGRRLRAWELKQQGWKQRDIATALGVTEGAVSQWLRRAREGGVEALRHQPSPGPQPRLSPEQRAQIPTLLAKGAEAYGFRGNLWTTKRVATVIEREFGVRYHPAHISRLLREIGWTSQKPIKRASHRDEAAIEAWQTERWPILRKRTEAEERTIVWVDESGFYLLPGLVRTYAPRGQTPILRLPYAKDHLSAIGTVSPGGKLYLHVQERAYRSKDVVRFLKHLLRQIPGRLLVIRDGCRSIGATRPRSSWPMAAPSASNWSGRPATR